MFLSVAASQPSVFAQSPKDTEPQSLFRCPLESPAVPEDLPSPDVPGGHPILGICRMSVFRYRTSGFWCGSGYSMKGADASAIVRVAE
jgi:hypothetical protein